MNEDFLKRYKNDKEYIIDVSEFDFYTSALKKLAMKIRMEYSKPILKNYYL